MPTDPPTKVDTASRKSNRPALRPAPRAGRLAGVLCLVHAALLAVGCTGPRPIDTPMLDTRNPELTVNHRLRAADLAWQSVQPDPETRAKARSVFKSLVWSDATPRPLRLKLADHLLGDTSPEGLEDSERFTVLRLPTEPDRAIVGKLALAAARHGWTDATPSLVRRLAEPIDDIPDAERVEALALQSLHPGEPLERIVFDTFTDPGVDAAPAGVDFARRVRADAWALLSRLDPSGAARRALILDPGQAALGDAGPLLADLRAGAEDLRVVPSTAMELDWLRALRRDEDNAAWWRECAALVSRLDQAHALSLRHLEAIRIASHTRPTLLRATRQDLLAMLESRLDPRDHHRRTSDITSARRGPREHLNHWRDRLTWADALAILITDDAVQTPSLAATIAEQALLDRDDPTTEYGGVIEAVNASDGTVRTVRAVLFPPRSRDRVDDDRFIASQDMIDYSDRALAHYHLQVQKTRNAEHAGPSNGDLRYAQRSGRNCLVFTSLAEDRLGVDYYQPDGVVIDLGEIRH